MLWPTRRTLFAEYLLEQDECEMSVPSDGVAYELQRQLTETLHGFLTATIYDPPDQRKLSPSSNAIDEIPNTHKAVLGTVDFFDRQKGFGFVDIPEIGERCYVGGDVVASSEVETLRDGDDILCDVGPSPMVSLI